MQVFQFNLKEKLMKLTFKKLAFLLSLGLGLGLGCAGSAFAWDDMSCDILAVKCEGGNQTACTYWAINCQGYNG